MYILFSVASAMFLEIVLCISWLGPMSLSVVLEDLVLR